MKNEQELKALVCRLILDIAPEADIDALNIDEDFTDELDLDSIDFMNLLEAVASETGVNISENDYEKVKSLQGMVGYIASSH